MAVLTASIITSKGIEQSLFTKEELVEYLGPMLCSRAFPDAFKFSAVPELKTTSRLDMRNVLIALIYFSYYMNRNFYRGSNQIIYVAMLKCYFSALSTSKKNSIKSVFATYTPKGIEVLKSNLGKNPYIEEILSILKKHKLLH